MSLRFFGLLVFHVYAGFPFCSLQAGDDADRLPYIDAIRVTTQLFNVVCGQHGHEASPSNGERETGEKQSPVFCAWEGAGELLPSTDPGAVAYAEADMV